MQKKARMKHPLLFLLTSMLLFMFACPLSVQAANSAIANGLTCSSDDFTFTTTDNSVTASFANSKSYSQNKTITISYTAPSDGGYDSYRLSFSCTQNSYASFNGGWFDSYTEFTSSNEYTVKAGETLTLTTRYQITKKQTGTVTFGGISVTPIVSAPLIQVPYDENYSITVNGTAIKADWQENADSVQLSVTPKDATGLTFLGWVGSDGKVWATTTSATVTPGQAVTLRPVYTNGNDGYYMVGSTVTHTYQPGLLNLLFKADYYTVPTKGYLFTDLQDALDAAASSTYKVVLPLQNVTVPVREGGEPYTIPTGVTLLVPYDDSYTMYPGQPVPYDGTYATPSAYRTMTLADGVEIVVNGTINVSATHYPAKGSQENGGSPTGPCGFIKMEGSSKITVNSGGALRALGFVTGSGSVTANSGSAIYEMFQFMDFRGGTQTTSMANRVFPLSQYYVQNIEVPLAIKQGAVVSCYTTIYMQNTCYPTSVVFIGIDSGFFRIQSGQVVKEYDGTKDRLIITATGQASLSNITMEFSGTPIDSADYEMPVNGNITVNITGSGSIVKISQNVALLPGSVVNIGNGATFILESGYSAFVYDKDEWGNYCGPNGAYFCDINYAPGKTYTRTAGDLMDATVCVDGLLDASGGNLYTTASGANIYSTDYGKVIVKATENSNTYQQVGANEPAAIPITSAILQNGDTQKTATVETAGVPAGTTFYYHPEHQRWIPVPHDAGTDKQICACGLTNYSFRYSNQIGWDGAKTMWYLKSNLYVQLGGKILDHTALSALDYGVFFMTETEWTNYKSTNADANSLTKPSIAIMREAGKEYTKDGTSTAASVAVGDKGAMVTAELQDYFLTSQLEDENIYVLFYIVDKDSNGNPLHCFGQVMTRNLKALANTAYSDTTGRFDAEKSIYGVMIGVLQTVEEHQSTFTSIPAMPSYMSAAPSVGYFGPTSNAGLAVKHSASVVLIEPWGLRLNGYISGSFDDYGLVILNDRDREYRYEMPSPQQLMANPDAQVYSVSDGSAAVNFGVDIGTGSFTQITTDYIGDLRTYELGNNIYVAFFVKDGGNYRFGEVQKYNVYLLCRQALAMDLPESEKAVYLAMIDMFHKVSDYRK